MAIEAPYLIFLGDIKDDLSAKTGKGVADWRPDRCMGEVKLSDAEVTIGLPEISIADGAAKGARTLIIGGANAGGVLPATWIASIVEALNAGMDVASGLHQRLIDVPEIAEAAKSNGRTLHDVRHPTEEQPIGKGYKRRGKRLLTVGTDCSVGKMYTALAIDKELRDRGADVDFRATGQTGILITGEGISVDAVVADFIAGSIENITPEADSDDHWDIVEGQGSLFHPSFAGVTIGLIHGSQPDWLVVCHEPTRPHMRGIPGRSLPDLNTCMERNIEAAKLTNPDVKVAGFAINTSAMSDGDAKAYLADISAEFGMPAVDPVRTGVAPLVDVLL